MTDKSDDPPKRTQSAVRPLVVRDALGRVTKGGALLNPSGRPKGIGARIRAETNDLEDQINMMIKISRGLHKGASTMHIIEAIKWLADRGHGKAVETSVQLTMEAESAPAELVEVSDRALEDLARTLDPIAASAVIASPDWKRLPDTSARSIDRSDPGVALSDLDR